jgi:hypothetical protein
VADAALEMHLEQAQSRFPQDVLQGIPTTRSSLPDPGAWEAALQRLRKCSANNLRRPVEF